MGPEFRINWSNDLLVRSREFFFFNLPLWILGTVEILINNTQIEVFKVL